MIDNYFELKMYDFKRNNFLITLIIILFIFMIILSSLKVTKYNSYSLINDGANLFIKCNNDCKVIEDGKTLLYKSKKIPYIYLNEINNDLYKIKIKNNISFKNTQIVKVPLYKISEQSIIFNVFKRKE